MAQLDAQHEVEIALIHAEYAAKEESRRGVEIEANRQIEQRRFEEGRQKGIHEGKVAAAMVQISKPPPAVIPLPRPRWSVAEADKPGDGRNYILRNSVPRSVAKEVHLDSDSDFEIEDAGHWEELSGESIGSFRGSLLPSGWMNGVVFTISWYDETAVEYNATYLLPSHG